MDNIGGAERERIADERKIKKDHWVDICTMERSRPCQVVYLP